MKQSGWTIFIAVAVGIILLSTMGILTLGKNADTPENSSAYHQTFGNA